MGNVSIKLMDGDESFNNNNVEQKASLFSEDHRTVPKVIVGMIQLKIR